MEMAQILVVEDESIVAKDIQNILIKLGYSVPSVVHSAEEAVKKAAEDLPDLVLMDIVLKGAMDGVEAAEQIRARFGIPIVYLTAYADNDTLQRAKITGPFGYILKPFEEKNLEIAIEIALHTHMMEKKLEESRQWFETTLRSIGDTVIATDTSGCITFMNPVAEALTGWNLKSAMGKKLTEVVRGEGEEVNSFFKNFGVKALNDGLVMNLANYTFLSKDGKETVTDACVSPIKDGRGYGIGVVWAFRDITERGEMEAKLREAMEAKSQFVSMVSHELRTPLTAIKEGLSIISDGTAGEVNAEQKEFLGIATRNVDRLGRLINDILNFQKLGSGRMKFNMRENNINEVVKEIQTMVLPQINVRGLRFIVNLDKNLPVSIFDKDKIIQVLLNIVNNAIKFTDKGDIVIITRKCKDFIHVSVEDTGTGIKKEDIRKLFHKFEQLANNRSRKIEGTGLGLAISREIIVRHNGKVWAESEPGKGTTFYFVLPLNPGKIADSERNEIRS